MDKAVLPVYYIYNSTITISHLNFLRDYIRLSIPDNNQIKKHLKPFRPCLHNSVNNILYILILISWGCNNQDNQKVDVIALNRTEKVTGIQKTDNSKYHTLKDTVLIETELSEPLCYSKAEFNDMVDRHPEFFQEYPNNPDMSYYLADAYDGFESIITDVFYLMKAQEFQYGHYQYH